MKRLLFIIPLLLVLAQPASAHVSIQPSEVPADGFARLDVRVPNESDAEGTVKLELQMPPGFGFVSHEPVPGWEVKIAMRKLDKPITVEGLDVTEEVDTVTFEGDGKEGIIGPRQFRDFGLSVRVPAGKAGDTLTFKALQTYEDGEVVRWIGAEDADEPAPTVTLTAATGGHGGSHGAEAETAPAASSATQTAVAVSHDKGHAEHLAIAALIVGGLGLLLGGAAFVRTRKRPATP